MKNDAPSFNIFEWPAPALTLEEFLREIKKSKICGKKIKNLRIIGAFGGVSRWTVKSYIAEKLKKAGVPPDHELIKKQAFDAFFVEPSFTACEPLVMEFDDGSTFEFLPLRDQRVRLGKNFIPSGVKDGMDHNMESVGQRFGISFSDFYLKDIEIKNEDKQEYLHILTKDNKYEVLENYLHNPTVVTYRFTLENSSNRTQFIIKTNPFNSFYNVSLVHYDIYMRTCSELMNILPRKFSISLHYDDSDSFFISPAEQNVQPEEFYMRPDLGHSISIEENLFEMLLYDAFKEHFLFSEQNEIWYDEDGFDWYGCNIYSFSSMKLIVSDIKKKIRDIQEHSSKLDFDELRNSCELYEFFLSENPDAAKDMDIDYEEVVIDFYTRFCRYCEAAMRVPNFAKFYVIGP